MDETYDVIVLGTGLIETVISGLLSVSGRKVLHLDRNSYYGGACASVNLTNLLRRYGETNEKPNEILGHDREWNVDLIPKFILASGKLVQLLMKTTVSKYLEFKSISGCFVYQNPEKSKKWAWSSFLGGGDSDSKIIFKVPSTDMEALASSLLPMTEKLRGKSFFSYAIGWNKDDPATWGSSYDYNKTTMRQLYNGFGLSDNTIDFIGHAIALYTNDEYLDKPMGPTMDRVNLYVSSLARYGSSPFIYPIYGLGTLPEGFSRLSARYGGTYMLNANVEQIVYDDADGKVMGVKTVDGEIAKAPLVVCDWTYLSEEKRDKKVRKVGQVIRVICILDHPIPNTTNRPSCQIIMPQKQLDRKNDIYIACVSHTHGVAADGYFIAIVSTTVETNDPEAEVKPALELLGPILKKFVEISPIFEDIESHDNSDNVFVSESYDATSHFESTTESILKLYRKVTGTDFDVTMTPEDMQRLKEELEA